MKDSIITVLDMIFYVLWMLLLGALLLFILFITFFCLWFGTNPITFIGAFFFDTGAMEKQHLVEDVKPVLEIGEVWKEESLFEVQLQSVKEVPLVQFDENDSTLNGDSLANMRAFQITFSVSNLDYIGTKTATYGNIKGLYTIVHAYNKDIGPLQSNHDGIFGIAESDGKETIGIEKGQMLSNCQQIFLVQEEDQKIYIVVEIPSEKNSKKMYRQEYQYEIPPK